MYDKYVARLSHHDIDAQNIVVANAAIVSKLLIFELYRSNKDGNNGSSVIRLSHSIVDVKVNKDKKEMLLLQNYYSQIKIFFQKESWWGLIVPGTSD